MITNKEIREDKERQINIMQKRLDNFIQDSLNKFKFVEVKRELYSNVGDDVNSIISHKSTIPDLVIWNKPFNKNECFENMKDLIEYNKYPRIPFYLRLNNKQDKNKNRKYISQYKQDEENTTYENLASLVGNLNINNNAEIKFADKSKISLTSKQNEKNNIISFNNISNSFKKENNNVYGNINYINEKEDDNVSSQFQYKNNKTNYISPVNKTKKTMNDYYQNQFNQNELLMNYVYSFLDKKGWIIFRNGGDYISNFTSFELFTYLTNSLKINNDLKMYIIGMQTDSLIFNGEQIYIILSQTLPIILQKKQIEYEMRKKKMKENDDKKLLKLDNEEKENISNNYSFSNFGNNNYKNIIINKDMASEFNENNTQKYQL